MNGKKNDDAGGASGGFPRPSHTDEEANQLLGRGAGDNAAAASKKRHWTVLLSLGMNYMTMLAAAVGLVTNALLLSHYDDHPVEYLLRVYTIAMCVMVGINECEAKRWFSVFGAFRYWTGRGAFMGLVALLTYHLPHAASDAVGGDGGAGDGFGGDGVMARVGGVAAKAVQQVTPWLQQLRLAAAYGMGALGAAYFVLGILCFRRLKDAQLRKIKERRTMRVEMEELYERKQEIERMMSETENKLDRL